MIVEPLINEALFIVAAVMIGLVNVLFVRVAVPTSVRTTPELGNVAVDDMPIPPLLDCRMPLTAFAFARFNEPKYGVPPTLETVRTEYALPVAVESRLPVPPPMITPLFVKLVDPVPPFATLSMPLLIMFAEMFGMSEADRFAPE